MRYWLLVLILAVTAACPATGASTHVSKKDRQAAEKEFKRAMDLQQAGKVDEALEAASHALLLNPGSVEYATAKEMLRQQIVGLCLTRGNNLAAAGDQAGARAQFRARAEF